jgi:hypothetical protein
MLTVRLKHVGSTAIYNPTQVVDILKELHKQDPMSTKVGAAMASNTTLYMGDVGLTPEGMDSGGISPAKVASAPKTPVDKAPPAEKPKMMPNFFKKK